MPKNSTELRDIASYVERTYTLNDKDKLALGLILIQDSGIRVRPEVADYVGEALREAPDGFSPGVRSVR